MTGLRTAINNDGNVGALGEFHFGAGQGYQHIVYVSIGTGIGGGVITNGRLLLGRRGLAAEVGHMSIVDDGAVCSCGNSGCWEALASGSALSRLIRSRSGESTSTKLNQGPRHNRFNRSRTFDAAAPTTADMQTLLQQEARYLGIGITNLIHIFSPECVILGGGVAEIFDQLIDTITQTIGQRAMPPFREVPILPAQLGKDAGVVGAASLILRE
jgi:glucokinase